MTLNTSFNSRAFLSTPHLFNGDRFELWKDKFKVFIQSFYIELWETIISCPFVPTQHVNDEVVDKPDFVWTMQDKRKFEIG